MAHSDVLSVISGALAAALARTVTGARTEFEQTAEDAIKIVGAGSWPGV
jgi:hypothetical protein